MKLAVDISALKERKAFLEKELNYINGLLELYKDEGDIKVDMISKNDSKPLQRKQKQFVAQKGSFMEYVYNSILELGNAYIYEIFENIRQIYPKASSYSYDSLHSKVRASVYTLKKRNKIEAVEGNDNKFIYSIKK